MTITDYRVVNPATGDNFYEQDGTAYDSQGDFTGDNPSAQPTVKTGRAKGLYSNRTLLNNLAFGFVNTIFGSQVVAGANVGAAAWAASAVSITSVTATNGKAVYTLNGHSLVVGDILNVTDTNSKVNGTQKVTAITTNTFTTNKLYTSGAGTMTYYLSAGTFVHLTAGEYVMRRLNQTTLAGSVTKTVLRSGAADPHNRRSIHYAIHNYARLVATAIRAGYWNEYSGTWSTAPTNSDAGYFSVSGNAAVTDGSADDAANPTYAIPGELVYRTGKPLAELDDYVAKTG